MSEYTVGNKNAIIILHEIYGINQFISDTCISLNKSGFDVYCPSMTDDKVFDYKDQDIAYKFFSDNVGFDISKNKLTLAEDIKKKYDKVYVLGFSVGATIAWNLSERFKCDGIICCYGSRIREYLSVKPLSPVLMLLSTQDTGNKEIVEKLSATSLIKIENYTAKHGFIDNFSPNYDQEQSTQAKEKIKNFIGH